MLLDNTQIFSDAQKLGAAGTLASANTLVQAAKGDAYQAPWFIVKMDEAGAGLTELKVELKTASDEAFTSPKVLYTSPAFTAAELTQDAVLCKLRLPPGVDKYLKVDYTTAGTASAGSVSAFLTPLAELD